MIIRRHRRSDAWIQFRGNVEIVSLSSFDQASSDARNTKRSAARERLAEELALIAVADPRAMARLYEATSVTLFGICYRVLHDRPAAEDILQDVYLTIWTKAGLYDARKSNALTWMGTIARNRAIDHLRTSSRTSTLPLPDFELIADTAPAAEPVAELERRWSRLMEHLDRLEPRHASSIRSAYLEGQSYEVLAKREGVPACTLKSWVRRGLIRLRNSRLDWE